MYYCSEAAIEDMIDSQYISDYEKWDLRQELWNRRMT